MRHRIITDGKKFRVETLKDYAWQGEHYIPLRNLRGEFYCLFNSAKKAKHFIRKKYGTSATIDPPTWKPI